MLIGEHQETGSVMLGGCFTFAAVLCKVHTTLCRYVVEAFMFLMNIRGAWWVRSRIWVVSMHLHAHCSYIRFDKGHRDSHISFAGIFC